jgi:hypothetical protein
VRISQRHSARTRTVDGCLPNRVSIPLKGGARFGRVTRHVEAVEAGDEDCALDRWGDVGEQVFVTVLEEEG